MGRVPPPSGRGLPPPLAACCPPPGAHALRCGFHSLAAGTALSATFLLISAAGGLAGLAMPEAMAWLGWVAGPILILAFGAVTGASAHMLRRNYRINNVEFARRGGAGLRAGAPLERRCGLRAAPLHPSRVRRCTPRGAAARGALPPLLPTPPRAADIITWWERRWARAPPPQWP